MSDDLAKRLRETTYMYQVDCELKMKCADRIEELEAKVKSMAMDNIAADLSSEVSADRIKELEAENAKLKVDKAKAVEALSEIKSDLEDRDYNSAYLICKHTIEELTGGKNA